MNSRFNRKLHIARERFHKKAKVKEQLEREEAVLLKLESKLGKPKKEVKQLVGDNLLSLLALVPFSTK